MALVPQKTGQVKRQRHIFSASDDNAMMKQIQATHSPDGREFSLRPVLLIIEDVFHRAVPASGISDIIPHQGAHDDHSQLDDIEEKVFQDGFSEMLELASQTIHKVSCEMSCKCSGGGDAHSTTLAIFNTLSSYSWDAKLVLALAAFAVNYGEFWLVAQLYLTNPLARAVALLKQLSDSLERADVLKPKFEALSNLIKAMMDIAKCIVDFRELPSQYITPETPEMLAATDYVPIAVYWTIRSIVACASQIVGLIGLGHEFAATTTETWELSSLAHKINNIHGHLMKQLTLCYHEIDVKRQIEAYQNLIRLFETIHADNMKVLKALIYPKDDQLPLLDGSTKKRVSLDGLRRKNVLLLISDLELARVELSMLQSLYTEARENPDRPDSHYEVVWIPIVDRSSPWNEKMQKQFEELQSEMPWYSIHHPSMVDPAVIKFIKEVWRFNKRPLLVVLDPQGKVVNPNAIHMTWIWAGGAFPFTSAREEALWKEATWKIELLADGIDENVLTWIKNKEHICLFGGEDTEWIRSFTTTAQQVAKGANISLKMLYVGKSNPRENVRKNNAIIQSEGLANVLPDLAIWFFWVRLESMWHSKIQHNKSVENDQIMSEIMTMLSFDGSEQGWAVIGTGTSDMAKGKGDIILRSFVDFETWKPKVDEVGFMQALIEYLQELHTPHHCNRLILPGTTGGIPERVVCAECGRSMEKFIMYRCCTD